MIRISLLMLACLAPLAAQAHALLKKASPLVGSTVTTPPAEVWLDFSEGIEPAFCTVTVTNAAGVRVDHNDLHGAGAHLAVGVGPLTSGTYKVVWHALSVDTHRTEGSFSFTVAQEAPR